MSIGLIPAIFRRPRRGSPTALALGVAIALGASACASPDAEQDQTEPVVALPFPDDPTLWPSIREERIATLLGPAMERAGVDA